MAGKQAAPEATFKAGEAKPIEMPSKTPIRRMGTDWCDAATGKPYHFDELLARGLLVKLESRMLADPDGEKYTQPAVCNAYANAMQQWQGAQRRPR